MRTVPATWPYYVPVKPSEIERQTVTEICRGGITGRRGKSRGGRLGVLLLAASLAACGGPGGPSGSARPTATFHGSVPTFRGDSARTGVMPGPGPSGSPAVAWKFQADSGSFRAPAVVDGVVYALAGDGLVHALELGSGHERWKADLGVKGSVSSLVVGDLVIAADGGGTIHALAVSNGKSAWTVRTDGPMPSPAAVGDRIFAATQNGSVYALDALSGRILWQRGVEGATSGAVAAAGGAIYLALGREIVAVSASDGSILWRAAVATDGHAGTPVVAGGRVFAAVGLDADDSAAHAVVSLDAATGKLLWRYADPGKAAISTPAVAGDRAFVAQIPNPGGDRLLVALDVASGAIHWSVARSFDIEVSPAVVGNTVFIVGNDGPVEAIDATNRVPLWSVPVEGVPSSLPLVVDGYLVVGTDSGVLYAIAGR